MTNPETKIPIPEREMPNCRLNPAEIAAGVDPDGEGNQGDITGFDKVDKHTEAADPTDKRTPEEMAKAQAASLARVHEKLTQAGLL